MNPKEAHWKFAKRTLRYLQYTIDYGITYAKDYKKMRAYADSD